LARELSSIHRAQVLNAFFEIPSRAQIFQQSRVGVFVWQRYLKESCLFSENENALKTSYKMSEGNTGQKCIPIKLADSNLVILNFVS
jgi:hypothetical protein